MSARRRRPVDWSAYERCPVCCREWACVAVRPLWSFGEYSAIRKTPHKGRKRLGFVTLGHRRLIAGTCRKCGKLVPGSQFDYHTRNRRDWIGYIDQRCVNCKWGHKAKGSRNAA